MIDWGQIFYGATLSTAIAAIVFTLIRHERTVAVLVPALVATFFGPLAWNAILHRAATEADGFFVDIPFKPFPVSWQDTGSGVFTLALASILLGLVLRQENAGSSSRPRGHRRRRRLPGRHLPVLMRLGRLAPLLTGALPAACAGRARDDSCG